MAGTCLYPIRRMFATLCSTMFASDERFWLRETIKTAQKRSRKISQQGTHPRGQLEDRLNLN